MAPSTDFMSGRPILPSGFAAFPREIRDLVFLYIAFAAGVSIDYLDNYLLHVTSDDYAPCIQMLHDWAPRSYIARGACEMLWSRDNHKFDRTDFSNWPNVDTDTIIDPHHILYLEDRDRPEHKRPVGIPVDLRMCVRGLRLFADANPHGLADPAEPETESLLRLKRELSHLHQFPRLRQLQIEVWVPEESDAYLIGMTVVESISDACKELRARIGTGLTVLLSREWGYDLDKFEYIETHDLSWMWEGPNQMQRERVREDVATADEAIRVLITDGVEVEREHTLLEALRYRASFLPQTKDEIVEMDVWEPWTGITKRYWQELKENWWRWKEGED